MYVRSMLNYVEICYVCKRWEPYRCLDTVGGHNKGTLKKNDNNKYAFMLV